VKNAKKAELVIKNVPILENVLRMPAESPVNREGG